LFIIPLSWRAITVHKSKINLTKQQLMFRFFMPGHMLLFHDTFVRRAYFAISIKNDGISNDQDVMDYAK
jgi:hypothetical protein